MSGKLRLIKDSSCALPNSKRHQPHPKGFSPCKVPGMKTMLVDRFHPDPHQKTADEANLPALNEALQNINTALAMVERDR